MLCDEPCTTYWLPRVTLRALSHQSAIELPRNLPLNFLNFTLQICEGVTPPQLWIRVQMESPWSTYPRITHHPILVISFFFVAYEIHAGCDSRKKSPVTGCSARE